MAERPSSQVYRIDSFNLPRRTTIYIEKKILKSFYLLLFKLAIEQVVRSLKKAFPYKTNLAEVVKKYVAEILGQTTNGMRGGKKE